MNGLSVVVNLMDAVYFKYTMRRTTTTVFGEFQNEGNLGGIFLTEVFRHWYLVLLFVVFVFVLWRLYAVPRFRGKTIAYYVSCAVSLLLAVPLCVAGMRGGFTTAVRPITISNANQDVERPTDAALVLNTPFALIRTIGKDVFTVPRYFGTKAELEAVYTPIHRPSPITQPPSPNTQPPTPTTHHPTPKNIIILIVESFGREYIGALNKDLEVAPTRATRPASIRSLPRAPPSATASVMDARALTECPAFCRASPCL